MKQRAAFKRQLSFIDLTLIGVGSIIGSSWLFASLFAAQVAGPSAFLSWLIGAVASYFIALTLAELGGALPRTGGIVRYPAYSHGPLIGYLNSFMAFIGYSVVAGLEAVAVRSYASGWWPALGEQNPTVLGWVVQAALLSIFFWINFRGVKSLGKVNNVITFIKFAVPLLTIIVLLSFFKAENFSSHGFATSGVSGILSAVSTTGIIFAFMGFQNIVLFSSEVKNPSRVIPQALFSALFLSACIYALLQISFVGAIPAEDLSKGWAALEIASPFVELVTILGIGWLAKLIMADAVISPGGTGNIYLAATARQIYAWSRNGTFFRIFSRVDENSGVPRLALWLAFFMSLFWTLPFPSWQMLVQISSAAGILTFSMLPVAVTAFRRTAPDLKRPFRVRGVNIVAPIAYIVSSLIIYWVGWETLSWLLSLLVMVFALYCAGFRRRFISNIPFSQQLRSTWWFMYYVSGMFILSFAGTFGGIGVLPAPWDAAMVAIHSLVSFYLGVVSATPAPVLLDDEEEVECHAEQISVECPKEDIKTSGVK
ncbi:APC family permease [Bacillus xiapuensis]|uniref:APC family permease n=1 Tax=Bacillus xiapuensis TaxID=2014075 RepID=UPI000C24B29E|nr:APC family permease [Bacillus xiapuensis]